MNKLREGFIGLDIEINESKNTSLVGLKGKIIDETKNTFKVKTGDKTKIVLKSSSTFNINGEIIKGDEITKRSYDRIKIKK